MFECGFCFLLGQVFNHKWISQMDSFALHLPDGECLSSWSWNSKTCLSKFSLRLFIIRIIRLSITGRQRLQMFGSYTFGVYFNGKSGCYSQTNCKKGKSLKIKQLYNEDSSYPNLLWSSFLFSWDVIIIWWSTITKFKDWCLS